MSVIKKPDLSNPILRAKLAKGTGQNDYGELAWPNDHLYIFPVVILGTFALVIGLSVLEPSSFGEKADPFATPLEIFLVLLHLLLLILCASNLLEYIIKESCSYGLFINPVSNI